MPGAKVVSTRRTPWVRGPSAVTDAMVIGGVTIDNDVYFERVVTYASFKKSGAKTLINGIGVTIDTVLNDELAIGAAFVQDTDPSGLLRNYMEFVIQGIGPDDAGVITDTVSILMQTVHDGGVGQVGDILRAAIDALDGIINR